MNPNDAGQLGAGECFVISGRRAQWVKVKRIELKPVLVKLDTSPVAERLCAKYQARAVQAAAEVEAGEAPQPSHAVSERAAQGNNHAAMEQTRSTWFTEDE